MCNRAAEMRKKISIPRYWRLIMHLLSVACLILTCVLFVQNSHLRSPAASADPGSYSQPFRERPTPTTTKSRRPHPRITTKKVPTCQGPADALWSKSPDRFRRSVPQCDTLFPPEENETAVEMILSNLTDWTVPDPHSDSSLLDMLKNCSQFMEVMQLPKKAATKEEEDFPLAYIFVAHRNAAQTVRLFRMLYQPQNAYCLTYDAKSSDEYKNITVSLASCAPENVYLTPRPEPIYYFGYSILRSVMACMDVLAASPIRWRYVQVVSWNDFPLRTNWEMVKIFKILNGSQDSELMHMNTPEHFTYKFGEAKGTLRSIPPGDLKIYKGSFATSMSREFVHFILNDPTATKFYQWLSDAKAPEELFWPTLVHNLQLKPPGGFPGECEPYYTSASGKKPFLSRFQVWIWESKKQCKGVHVNWSCVFGIKDLSMLVQRPEFVAHKVYEEYQPALSYCLEEWHWRRACMGDTRIVTTYYENLPSVQYQRISDKEREEYVCKL